LDKKNRYGFLMMHKPAHGPEHLLSLRMIPYNEPTHVSPMEEGSLNPKPGIIRDHQSEDHDGAA